MGRLARGDVGISPASTGDVCHAGGTTGAMSNGEATSSYRVGTRRKSGPNMGLIAVLVAAVLLLLLVLIWILSDRGGSSREAGNSVAASVMTEHASRTSLTT